MLLPHRAQRAWWWLEVSLQAVEFMRALAIPSSQATSTQFPVLIGHSVLHHPEMLRATLILQPLLKFPLSSSRVLRGSVLAGMHLYNRISAKPRPVRWGKYFCPHFTDEETSAKNGLGPCLARHCTMT